MSGIATAIIGSTVVSSLIQSDAAGDATQAQVESGDKAIGEQRRQFDKLQEVLAPFTGIGEEAVGGISELMGFQGPEAATAAIAGIEESPEFAARTRLGEEAILQNASATGGLRGGNTEEALAQFRPQILSDLINQRFQRLGGLAQLGQSSAAGVGAGAINTGQNISGIMQNQGEAIGQGALAKGNAFGDVAGSIGTVAGMSEGRFGKF